MKKENRVHTDSFIGTYSTVIGSFSILEQEAGTCSLLALIKKKSPLKSCLASLAIRNGFNYVLKKWFNQKWHANNVLVVVNQPRRVSYLKANVAKN